MPENREGGDENERARRAAALRALLNDPEVKKAVAGVQADLAAAWKRAQAGPEREKAWSALQALEALLTRLRSDAGQG